MEVSRSSPQRKFSTNTRQIGLWLCLLAGIAVLMSLRRPPAEVTVSGLTLSADRAQVLAIKGQPDYQEGHPQPTHLEYWSDPVAIAPSLSLDFNDDGQMIKLRGGQPEINKQDVRRWSLAQIELALGPPSGASRSQAMAGPNSIAPGDAFLKYPERHLLVTWNQESGIDFILFAGTR
jgi:hypothetical protein